MSEVLQSSNRFKKNIPFIVQDLRDIEEYIRANYSTLSIDSSYESLLHHREYFKTITYESNLALESISKNIQNHTLTKGDSAIRLAFSSVLSFVEDFDEWQWAKKQVEIIERNKKLSAKVREGIEENIPSNVSFGQAFRISNMLSNFFRDKYLELVFHILLGNALRKTSITNNIIGYLFKLYQEQWDESIKGMRKLSIDEACSEIRNSYFQRIDSKLLEEYLKTYNIDLNTIEGREELIKHISSPVEFYPSVDWDKVKENVKNTPLEYHGIKWIAGMNPEMFGGYGRNRITGKMQCEADPRTSQPLNHTQETDESSLDMNECYTDNSFTIEDEVYSNLLDSLYNPESEPSICKGKRDLQKEREYTPRVKKEKV